MSLRLLITIRWETANRGSVCSRLMCTQTHWTLSWRIAILVDMLKEKWMKEERQRTEGSRSSLQAINKTIAEPGTAHLLPLFIIYHWITLLHRMYETAQTYTHTISQKCTGSLYRDLLPAEIYFYIYHTRKQHKIKARTKDQVNSTWCTAPLTSGNTSLYLHQYKITGIDTNMCYHS